LRIELDRRGLADHDLLAVLLADRLIDREHPHVSQNRLADEFLDACGLFRGLVAVGQHHVDVIVGQDEASGAGVGRHVQRYRAHPARQDRGHEAAVLGDDDLAVAYRLSSRDRAAHDGADEIFDGVRPVGLFEEARIGGVRRPGLPADIAVADHLADAEIGLGDQHFRPWRAAVGPAPASAARARACRSRARRQCRRRGERYQVRSSAQVSLRFTFLVTRTAGGTGSTGFHQPNVKAWLIRRIQSALITRYASAPRR
jgi:hypothetical protein